MKITLNLAGTNITINLLGQAVKAMHFCRGFFRDFVCRQQRECCKVTVSVLEQVAGGLAAGVASRDLVFEQLLPPKDVAEWLQQLPQFPDAFPMTEKTICSVCPDGLLLFNPMDAAGRIYLFKPEPQCLGSLHRLLWIYLAQVLGEAKACFVHAAALVKNKKGYLFLGDSGAGKSTLAGLSSECIILSDDSPVFCKKNDAYHVFPSPYCQVKPSAALKSNAVHMSFKVNGLYFLKQGDRLFLESVPKKEAFAMIIQRHILFFPHLSAKARSGLFDIFFEACDSLPLYFLHARQGQNVWSAVAGE